LPVACGAVGIAGGALMRRRPIGPSNDPYSAKPDMCPITAFSTGFRIFGNVDGLADRTLDSLKACGFDQGGWGTRRADTEASTRPNRGARRFAAAGGTPPCPSPRPARGLFSARRRPAQQRPARLKRSCRSRCLALSKLTRPCTRCTPAIETGL
jgi:hypothetical protein